MPATNADYQKLLSDILILAADLKAREYESFDDQGDFLIIAIQGLHDQLRNWLRPPSGLAEAEASYQRRLDSLIEHLDHLKNLGYLGLAHSDQVREEMLGRLDAVTGNIYAMGAVEP